MLERLLAALLLTWAGAVHAADSCAVPPDLTPAPAEGRGERRLLPVEKFVLAYYWWPQNCRQYPGEGCSQRFGFKVHGLWPDGAGETYPQYCRDETVLDPATVRANWCMTPAVSLLQHEWAKHGTCNWASPDAYFGDARRLAVAFTMPDVDRLPKAGLTAGRIRDAIVRANPRLPRTALFVGTDRKQWLTEVRICMDRRYEVGPCEGGKVGAPDRVPVRVWPRGR